MFMNGYSYGKITTTTEVSFGFYQQKPDYTSLNELVRGESENSKKHLQKKNYFDENNYYSGDQKKHHNNHHNNHQKNHSGEQKKKCLDYQNNYSVKKPNNHGDHKDYLSKSSHNSYNKRSKRVPSTKSYMAKNPSQDNRNIIVEQRIYMKRDGTLVAESVSKIPIHLRRFN